MEEPGVEPGAQKWTTRKRKKYLAVVYDALRPFEMHKYDHSETASQVEPPTVEDIMRLEKAAKLLEAELDKQEIKDSNAVFKESLQDIKEFEDKRKRSVKPKEPEPSLLKPLTLDAANKKGRVSVSGVKEQVAKKQSRKQEIQQPDPSPFKPLTLDASKKKRGPVIFNARRFPVRDESITMAPGVWNIPTIPAPDQELKAITFTPRVAEKVQISLSEISAPKQSPYRMVTIEDEFEKQTLNEQSEVPSEDQFQVDFPIIDAADWDRKPSGEKLKEKIQAAERRRKKQEIHAKFSNRITFMLIFVIFFCFRIFHTLFLIQTHEEHLMVVEELFRYGKLNCLGVFPSPDDMWAPVMLVYYLSCIFLVILTFSKSTRYYYLYFMFIQLFIAGLRIWYIPKLYVTKQLSSEALTFGIRYLAMDMICFTIVTIRFYHAANPAKRRDMYANTLLGDYLINDQIQFLVQPPFIRKKTALKRATAFQTLTVVRKLQEKQKATGLPPSQEIVNAEVEAAIRALNDWKKYPTLRIIHDYESRERAAQAKMKNRNKKIQKMKENFKKELARIRESRSSNTGVSVTASGRSIANDLPVDIAELMSAGEQDKEASSEEIEDFDFPDLRAPVARKAS